MFHNEGKNVQTCAGIILWDGITQPETKDDGSIVHSLKIAIPGTAPERAELDKLAADTLAGPLFKGNMPAGGEYPVREIDMTKFAEDADRLTGCMSVNANTRRGMPPVYDANGKQLSAMVAGQQLYSGAVVALLVHCYAFNNKSKGLAFGLDGIQIIDSAAPKLAVGGGMASAAVASIFAGGAPATAAIPPAAVAATPAPPAVPNVGFVTNAGRVMLSAANGASYDAMIAAGWTDDLLISNGMMRG